MTSKSIDDLEKEVAEKERAAQEARKALERARESEAAARMEPLKVLVKRAHDCLCRWNHTDGCSWGYEGDDWNGSAHRRWLTHYDRIINGNAHSAPVATIDEVETIISMVEQIKPKVRTAIWLIRSKLEP